MPSTDLLIFTGINVLLAWSVYVVLATGQISLGNAAFMAVGAFTASAITISFRLPLAVALVVAPLVAALFGVLVAFPALRIRGIYLLMVTLGVGQATQVFFLNFGPTGALRGISGMTGTTLPLVLASVLVIGLFLWWLQRSPLGAMFDAVKEDEVAAGALGINVTYMKVLAFGIGAAIAAYAGALYAHYLVFINPDHFGISVSILAALYVIMGGADTVLGPALGAVLLTLLPEYVRFLRDWRLVVYGLLIVVLMMVLPEGLLSRAAMRRLGARLRALARRGPPLGPEAAGVAGGRAP